MSVLIVEEKYFSIQY